MGAFIKGFGGTVGIILAIIVMTILVCGGCFAFTALDAAFGDELIHDNVQATIEAVR